MKPLRIYFLNKKLISEIMAYPLLSKKGEFSKESDEDFSKLVSKIVKIKYLNK